MRAHLIKDGIIINTVEVANLDVIPGLVLPVGEEKIGWSFDGSTFTPPVPIPETDEQRRTRLKAERTLAVEQITVTTTAGNVFDGDETSQTRMARAILALQATGTPSVNWVLHDNSVIQASVAELSEALALAGAAQAAVWVIA